MKTLSLIFGLLIATTGNIVSANVQYLTLDAELEDENVIINWITISETANLQFLVERLVSVDEWEIIGSVYGQGNSSTLIYYSFSDENPNSGTAHYRLKQMDFSGTHSYSQVLEVNPYQLWLDNANFYPNPVGDILNISLPGANKNLDIVILNSLGAIIKTDIFNSLYTMQLEMDELPKGYYYIQMNSEGSMVRKRILKM